MRKLTALTLGLLAGASYASGKSYLLEITGENQNLLTLQKSLEAEGLDVVGINKLSQRLEVVTDDPSKVSSFLKSAGDDSLVVSEVTESEGMENYRQELASANGETYANQKELLNEMRKLAEENPDFAKVIDLNGFTGAPVTAEGNHLFALAVSRNPSITEDEPKMLIVGEHHARELMTPHAVLDLAKAAIQDVKTNPEKSALAKAAAYFVPMANPDGLDYVFTKDRMWRKNRSQQKAGAKGVDLNRNYSFKWGQCGQNSAEPSSDVYKGPKAMSEAEVNLLDQFNAKLHFQYVISFHSSGDEVLYPYLCGQLAEATVINALRDKLATTLTFGTRKASSSGEDFEHHYAKYGSLSYLLEIGPTFQPKFSHYQTVVWPKVAKSLPLMLGELTQPYLEVQVLDQATNAPIQAAVSLNEVNFKEGESLRSTDRFGVYRWRVPVGNYHMTVSANGYQATTQTFDFKTTSSRVTLKLAKAP